MKSPSSVSPNPLPLSLNETNALTFNPSFARASARRYRFRYEEDVQDLVDAERIEDPSPL
ncbi:hypothetical protein FRC19_010009 [Serendipita sp. 401]|nr:hypothetical protein FRC18_004413 [Serendipita sp. 400]KAG8826005.1 hypothetical protein FRC19_010009 [Serendipita sp. 401]